DFLTARTFGATVRLVPTAWTAQSATGVQSVEPRDPRALAFAIREALRERSADLTAAVKVGMLPDAAAASAVAEALADFDGAIVFDPVLAASSGGVLFTGDLAALVALGARATLFTPNAVEAGAFAGTKLRALADAETTAALLCARGLPAVLVKGGHLEDMPGEAVDVLARAPQGGGVGQTTLVRHFRTRRIPGPAVRGTGCALATAIAVGLGRGLALEQAISEGKAWLTVALAKPVAAGGEWHLGS
ncbi:MAG: bifunctional hydroxymethylpyrimidine kinase/phosphomethylpyrimidine kinase, partial [Deltaproteobacteria bacterium]|nr:bifunctional hydroxymethylpyrimidine kinase/phosphomethylpyrimidine kinase [Deltaproteobacteria bacterium]